MFDNISRVHISVPLEALEKDLNQRTKLIMVYIFLIIFAIDEVRF